MFFVDIENLKSIKKTWTAGCPDSLQLDALHVQSCEGLSERQVWSVEQVAGSFLRSIEELRSRPGVLTFDKDDDSALAFVASTANLRAECFHIPRQSQFDIKAIAGNIIPAVATTNAIIAGLVVLEGIKILRQQYEQLRMIYCVRAPSTFRRKKCFLVPCTICKPDPKCYVCGKSSIKLFVNTKTMTLGTLVTSVLQGKLGMIEPSFVLGTDVIIEVNEEEPDLFEEQAPKTLESVGMTDSQIGQVEDFAQSLSIRILLRHKDTLGPQESEIEGVIAAPSNSDATGQEEEEEEELEAVDSITSSRKSKEAGKKRGAEELEELGGEEDVPPVKRGHVQEEGVAVEVDSDLEIVEV